MSASPEDCKQHALGCIALAQTAKAPELKRRMLELAMTWAKLAIELERTEALLPDVSEPGAKPR
jgi:hypothetical protein